MLAGQTWRGGLDITPRSADPQGAKRLAHRAEERSEWANFDECGGYVKSRILVIYPGTSVQLRCPFLIDGTARRQATQERALFTWLCCAAPGAPAGETGDSKRVAASD